MKKIIRQDGLRKVFICDDGTEIPFKKKDKKIFVPTAKEVKKVNEDK